MSREYDDYIREHVANVQRAFDWLDAHIPEVHEKMADKNYILSMHDASKTQEDEYNAYDAYFYGGNKSYKVVSDFNYAWLKHIHRNPHHWQYWVLKHDDEPEEALEMPYPYIIEMICDWWSFSFKNGNLKEIFGWYEKHKGMVLHEKTRKIVEDILKKIREELDKEEEND